VHVQIVTFTLSDISDADYRSACDGLADVFARVPGLVSKVWLADEASGTYGGVYTWADRAAMEAYLGGDIFTAIAADPNFVDVTSRDFAVLEGPTRVTRARVEASAAA
jgi:hypothetical protein